MEPRPDHSGGSVSANADAEPAALISARGTSVCARRSIMFGKPVAAGVWQTGKSGPTKVGETSAAVERPPGRGAVMTTPHVLRRTPPRAAGPPGTHTPFHLVY